MANWEQIRREHLQEMISILQKNLNEYEEKDISEWDDFNRELVADAIRRTKDTIRQHTEEIGMIDKSYKK